MRISWQIKSVKKWSLVGSVGLALSGLVVAQEVTPEVARSSASFYDAEMSGIDRAQYDLTEKEVSRAQRLRIIDRSFGVDNLSAVELLGKYAKTDTERMEYARKHVTAMADNVGRSQAWGMAVYAASQESNLVASILDSNPLIEDGLNRMRMAVPRTDYTDFDRKPPMLRTEPGRTLMMSVDCDECDEVFAKEFVLVMENKVDHLDVVFVDSTADDIDEIFGWAKSMAISKSVLESGKVNLHTDDEAWRDLRNDLEGVPRLIRK